MIKDFSSITIEAAFSSLSSSEEGLSNSQVTHLLKQYGYNTLPEAKKRSVVFLVLKQFKSILVGVLILASLLSWITGHETDAYVILVVVLIDAAIGFSQEWKAEQAVAALHKMLTPLAKVIRASHKQIIKAAELVPGDIILLEEGDYVPADARLTEAKNLRTVESSLTGESLPVNKTSKLQDHAISLGDRKNMVWRSTFISGGYAKAIVTATGSETEIGKVATSISNIKVERSHFQKKIDKLGTQMGVASVGAAGLLFAVGYFTLGLPLNELFLLAVAAMVSIIPEGLPSIIVIVLAIGSRRMTKRNAIVREFTATETLGAITTIITDKTGTLTENALTVRKIYLPGESEIHVSGEGWIPIGSFTQNDQVIEPENHERLKQLLKITQLGTNASIRHNEDKNDYDLIGDPTEGALVTLSKKAGISPSNVKSKKLDDLPFNSSLKLRASLVQNESSLDLFAIGAPEQILKKCDSLLTTEGVKALDEKMKAEIQRVLDTWSLDAMRVIALAFRETTEAEIHEDDLHHLTFSGLTGMIDPPRQGVKQAVCNCKEAGVRVIMATGDHISTAVAVAKAVGIIDGTEGKETRALSEEQLMVLDEREFDEAIQNVNVFARLNPDTKLRIATRLQQLGELIAMTGDGVNDAPALKKADVGIAMGIMGTDVARDSAKVVLADDNFSTIVSAIEEGRIVFNNARQAAFYLITTNFAEISTLIVTISFGLPIPLTAIQILWLNLVTDGIGDMALAAERGHGDALKMKPLHKDEKILDKSIVPFLAINVTIMTLLSLLAYRYFLPSGIAHARSGVFIIMSFTQLFNLYNMRSLTKSIFKIGLFSNPYVTLTFVSSAIITVGIIEIPFFTKLFQFGTFHPLEFALLIALSSLVLVVGEMFKYLKYKSR